MQTRREQVRAYNYQVRRLVRGVLLGRPEHWEQPFRRSSVGTMVGMVLALIGVAGCAVFSLIRPGAGPALASDTTVVLEKGSGTRYLVSDGVLRPVANLASALLLAGPELRTQTLSQQRTRALPRGTAVGIVGAPEDVPNAAGVSAGGWSVCVDATVATTGLAPRTEVSFTGTGGVTPFAAGRGLLVAGPDGTLHLVVGGTNYAIATAAARNALGYAATVPLRVTAPWLAALRPGRPVNTLDVAGSGGPGPVTSAGPTTVGQVLAVHQATSTQYFLVQKGRIVPITRFEALLVLGSPKLAGLYPDGKAPRVVPESAIATATRQLLPAALGWPEDVVDPVPADGRPVCVTAAADGVPQVGAGPPSPQAVPGAPRGVAVQVTPTSAVVVQETNAAGGPTGRVWLVDDTGRRFLVAGVDSLGALGLAEAARVAVPSGLLSVVPSGPTLSVEAAQNPVPAAAPGAASPSASGAATSA